MTAKANAFETALLQHLFQNANVANLGDATGIRGSTAAGSLFLALHTADPGEAGDQTTSEVSYTGYARVAVARSAAGFAVSGNAVTLVADAIFGTCTGGTLGTITHFSVGVAVSGASMILYRGAVSPTIVLAAGVQPVLDTTTNITED